MCVFKKIVKTRENFRIYVQISGPNSNFTTFQDKFQNFRTTPRPAFPIETRRDVDFTLGLSQLNTAD